MKTLIAVISIVCLLGCSANNPMAAPDKETGARMEFDLQWGGYYASREEGEDQYGVFRLLDFNRDAYHVALFKEKFAAVPTLQDVVQLSPVIGHAPFDSKALLRAREIRLLGGTALTEDDLEGYRLYLEHHGVGKDDIDKLFRTVIGFGHQPPMKIMLTLIDGELGITEQ
jgi:hypothetical protein